MLANPATRTLYPVVCLFFYFFLFALTLSFSVLTLHCTKLRRARTSSTTVDLRVTILSVIDISNFWASYADTPGTGVLMSAQPVVLLDVVRAN